MKLHVDETNGENMNGNHCARRKELARSRHRSVKKWHLMTISKLVNLP